MKNESQKLKSQVFLHSVTCEVIVHEDTVIKAIQYVFQVFQNLQSQINYIEYNENKNVLRDKVSRYLPNETCWFKSKVFPSAYLARAPLTPNRCIREHDNLHYNARRVGRPSAGKSQSCRRLLDGLFGI